MFAKISFRTGLKTVRTRTEKNVIHIHLENLILCVEPLDLQGDSPLVYLSRVSLVFVKEKIFCKLLGNGRRTFGLAGRDVLKYGSYDPIRVDTDMVSESIILDSEQSVGNFVGYILYFDRNAFFKCEFRKDRFAVIGINGCDLRRPVRSECGNLQRVSRVIQVIRCEHTGQSTSA